MREGIYLGPPPGRTAGIVRALLVLALLGVILQWVLYTRDRSRVMQLRDTVFTAESDSTPVEMNGAEAAEILHELHAVALVGVIDAIPPTSALRFVETVLPEGVVLTRLDIDVRSSAIFTLAAIAKSAEEISTLQREVENSPLVVSTELLEERRMPGGQLAIRLRVEVVEVDLQ